MSDEQADRDESLDNETTDDVDADGAPEDDGLDDAVEASDEAVASEAGDEDVPAAAPGDVAPGDPVWMVAVGGRQFGPYRQLDLAQMLQDRQMDPECLVWNPTMDAWMPARRITALAVYAGSAGESVEVAHAPTGFMRDTLDFFSLITDPFKRIVTLRSNYYGPLVALVTGFLFLILYFPGFDPYPGLFTYLVSAFSALMSVILTGLVAFGILSYCREEMITPRDLILFMGVLFVPLIPALVVARIFSLLVSSAMWLALAGVVAATVLLYLLLVRTYHVRSERAYLSVVVFVAVSIWLSSASVSLGLGIIRTTTEVTGGATAEATASEESNQLEGTPASFIAREGKSPDGADEDGAPPDIDDRMERDDPGGEDIEISQEAPSLGL